MKSNFTQAPWSVRDGHWNWVILGADGCVVCKLPEIARNKTENEANLRLIAAAPELVDALDSLVQAITGPMNEVPIQKALSVLAKARGDA